MGIIIAKCLSARHLGKLTEKGRNNVDSRNLASTGRAIFQMTKSSKLREAFYCALCVYLVHVVPCTCTLHSNILFSVCCAHVLVGVATLQYMMSSKSPKRTEWRASSSVKLASTSTWSVCEKCVHTLHASVAVVTEALNRCLTALTVCVHVVMLS